MKSALDFIVPTGGADLLFFALQPGSARGLGANHPVLSLILLFTFPRFLQVPVLAEWVGALDSGSPV